MSEINFDIHVEKLIPQRPPFLLVDKILSHDDHITESVFSIGADHILIEDGVLSAYGLIENMAQSAALRSGYEAYKNNLKPKTGFIGTITNSNIYLLPSAGSTIRTEVLQTTQIMNIIVIECKCFQDEILLADCSMKIVLMEEQPN